MPFEKGREKTGGRVKGSVAAARRSTKFVEQLKGFGFNYPQELAEILKELKDLRSISDDPKQRAIDSIRAAELKFYYTELKSLLPFMAPKLREKEVVVTESDETSPAAGTKESISDEDLLKALGDENKPNDIPRPSNPPVLGSRNPELQVPSSPDENLSDVAGEQEEDE